MKHDPKDIDMALYPARMFFERSEERSERTRRFQAIPTVEITAGGRLFVAFYGGDICEGPGNYLSVFYSDDSGETWNRLMDVDHENPMIRLHEPILFLDPQARLWLFWSQSYIWVDGRAGVWASCCENPDSAPQTWSTPVRHFHGNVFCKPTVLSSGRWLLPVALLRAVPSKFMNMPEFNYSLALCSDDCGKSFRLLGKADVPERTSDEPMIIERRDGSLWMLVRTSYGIGETFSFDGGVSWTPGRPSGIASPSSRFFIRRLASGKLLLVNHYNFTGRNNLTALLSDDDGENFTPYALLDGRDGVSYPDGCQGHDGRIYIAYDYERYGAKEILLASFDEQGPGQNCDMRHSVVCKAFGDPVPPSERGKWMAECARETRDT